MEYVNAGVIDEFTIALSPVLFGSGIRLFESVDTGRLALEPVRAEPTKRVTHLTYASGSGDCLEPQRSPPKVSKAGEIVDALRVRKGERRAACSAARTKDGR